MGDRLKVGIIGLGAFGESHIRAYRALPFVEIAGVASRSAARAADVARRYAIPQSYGSYADLIADPSIQAVSVTTVEDAHREPAIAAMRAGKHVLVEKPLATTIEDAEAMIDVANEMGVMLVPGHILRFDPKYAVLHDSAVSGGLGRLVAVTAKRNRVQSLIAGYKRVHPALVTAIHDIDIMLWTVASEVTRVYAVDRIADRDEGMHGLWGMLEFANGVVGTIETSWQLPDAAGLITDDAFQVTGLAGTAKIQIDTPALRVLTAEGSVYPDISYEPLVHGVAAGALRDELSHFAQCVLGGTPSPVISAVDGLKTLRVVLALIESAREQHPITLDEEGS